MILDGSFNDIENWDYGAVCQLINYGQSFKVETVEEFQSALHTAITNKKCMYVINAYVKESSRGMRLLAKEIGRRLKAAN